MVLGLTSCWAQPQFIFLFISGLMTWTSAVWFFVGGGESWILWVSSCFQRRQERYSPVCLFLKVPKVCPDLLSRDLLGALRFSGRISFMMRRRTVGFSRTLLKVMAGRAEPWTWTDSDVLLTGDGGSSSREHADQKTRTELLIFEKTMEVCRCEGFGEEEHIYVLCDFGGC